MNCPLCAHAVNSLGFAVEARRFFRCSQCDLVFVDPAHHLPPAEEKSRYEEHNNDVTDPRFKAFVRPLFEAICKRVAPATSGLDFGAGTGPVLSEMLEEKGYLIARYDPFFWPNGNVLQARYDFVFACEVVEHFFQPAREFELLRGLLKPRASLALMTLLVTDETDLSNWYYLRDPTHVCAYSQRTFHWITKHYGFDSVAFDSGRVTVLINRV